MHTKALEVDDRVEVRLHVNFLTSDTFIYLMKYSILDHYTSALESDCSLLDPGQYFLVSRVGSVSFHVPSSHLATEVHVAVVR